MAYPELVEWSVTFWGPKGLIVGRCDPKSDSEACQGMKNAQNESARNPTKPTPLRPARLPHSGGIIFMSNRVRMEKISHSVRQAKQAKFLDADYTCPYSPYRTRVSPYRKHGRSI